jgi:hypothetical protein
VESSAEAQTVLRTLQFDVVLAMEELVDGCGFELSQDVARRSASLFVQVELSEGHLWLPAVERGKRTLGERALDPAEFETQLVTLLSGEAANRLSGQARPTAAMELPRGLAPPFDGGDRNWSERSLTNKRIAAITTGTASTRGTPRTAFARTASASTGTTQGIAAERTSRIANRVALTAAIRASGKKKS